MPKVLVAFDFDHTIIDDNSDLYVRKLAPNGTLPENIKSLYSDQGWTEYMGAIFRYLHENGTTETDMLKCVGEIALTENFKELMEYLRSSQDVFEVIIISDSNSVFIDHILKLADLQGVVQAVYTNPAVFTESGCLTLKYYHTQDWCDISTINLCKGHILEDHIRIRKDHGVEFDMIAYVGDGSNDLCPSLRLGTGDLVFPRKGFSLIKKLAKLDEAEIKAKIIPWSNGQEIMKILKEKA